jgi:cytochrome c5
MSKWKIVCILATAAITAKALGQAPSWCTQGLKPTLINALSGTTESRALTLSSGYAGSGVGLMAAQLQSPSTGASKAAKKTPSPVHRIELPYDPPAIPDGPNVHVYRNHCLICHTARYVLMQPRFSKAVWQSEVKKMVDAYGASISEADQALIVQYLVAVRGAEAPASKAAPK